MNLFLSGGGDREDSVLLDKKFLEQVNFNLPILYIPIALHGRPYADCLEWVRGTFSPLGFDNFVMWDENDLQGKTIEDYKQFGGIYIGGGNTFRLLRDLKELGTFDILKNLAEEGMPIYGGSAGAIIFARTIIPALPYDDNESIGLSDFTGLNVLHDDDIWCHYNDTMDALIQNYRNKFSLERIIALPDNVGLFVSKAGTKVIGLSNAIIIDKNGRKEIAPENIILNNN
jgi:dipeptidase E